MMNLIFRCSFSVFLLFIINCTPRIACRHSVEFGDSLYLENVPDQPGEETWKFVEDLRSPMWTEHDWEPKIPGSGQADLSKGIIFIKGFPDPEERLETAYEDLFLFLAAGDVPTDKGKYLIETLLSSNFKEEAFRLEVNPHNCRIWAGNMEGIRRGIFYLEDEMLRLHAPFLPLGTIEKEFAIQSRISRCFFGPIKRPPAMRDELMDEVDYYPDNYLNRLAHEGVNGLWLTIEFRDLVSTRFTPDAGKDAERRLAKLKQTVNKCLRYGIKTYLFCIEPRAWDADSPVLKNYPELAGHKRGSQYLFCPLSESAHDYLYESVNKIFKAVPGLGGIINITHGERNTTCLSAVSATSGYKGKINCPRCMNREPWEILTASLSAMEQGMRDAAPDAKLISWLYMPQPQRYATGDPYSLGDWVYEIPAHTPEGVILQFNFESGVTGKEFGKLLVGGDYWISKPGPASRFERIATVARKNGTPVSAKIQTGSSHEVATVPFVPVPSLLYRKFAAMHRLGVSHTMLCWYFGNYPGLMNKAAGLLSMKPFPENEAGFLRQLASIYWKKEDVAKVVEAWRYFSQGYENYPLTNLFQYYGPMHDGPVWPLLLKPADAPLSPTWQIGSSTTLKPWPPSGDRIGECIGEILTLDETVELTRCMAASWQKGVEIFRSIEKKYSDDPERILDIGVAKALGIQFHSGYHILKFYSLREKMFRSEGKERLEILKQLTDIINKEIELDRQLLKLCEKDSRLGFHSEAEGYKYFPEKIRWRIEELKKVLRYDVPEIETQILKEELLFPGYTGKKPEGTVAKCISAPGFNQSGIRQELPDNLQWQPLYQGKNKTELQWLQWASGYDDEAMYVLISRITETKSDSMVPPVSGIQVNIEPRRLWPLRRFSFSLSNETQYRKRIRLIPEKGVSCIAVRIPFSDFLWKEEHIHPIRLNVIADDSAWCQDNPVTPRLMLGSDNPADLGWLIFI